MTTYEDLAQQALDAIETAETPEQAAAYREAAQINLRKDHEQKVARVEPYFPKQLPDRENRIRQAADTVDEFLYDIDKIAAIEKARRSNPNVWPRKHVTPDTSSVARFFEGKQKVYWY